MLRQLYLGLALTGFTFALTGCDPQSSSPAPAPSLTANFDRQTVDTALSDLVEENEVAGVSALIYVGDTEVYFGAFGAADKEADRPWTRDTLVTLYSMTKPITGVTLMSLYEEGLFDLEDPLTDYLSEFADVQVYAGTAADGTPILEAPRRAIKVIDIFRHTACFGYGWEDNPLGQAMRDANLLDPSKPLAQFSRDLAKVPLYCHPGEQWKYGVSVDVQARLAEVVSGQPYEILVQERVLSPLKMLDTGYFVPPSQKPRLAGVYLKDEAGKLTRQSNTEVYGFRAEKPVQINGGHGLVSTIDDYMRFARMLQNDGSFEGVEILQPETVALMARDHLPDGVTKRDFLPTKGQMGFGLDFAVRIAPPVDASEPFGVEGEFFWDGAATPLFWVDPKNDITVVFLTQLRPFDMDVQAKFRRAVYEAMGVIEGG